MVTSSLGVVMAVFLLAHPTPYDRNAYPHWRDFDSDCQDSRAEILIAESAIDVTFASPDQCRVVGGLWLDPYSGEALSSAGVIDVDHVVPLAWAHERGAYFWTELKRTEFANDPLNLVLTHRSLNRSKGASSICEWVPPDVSRRRQYAELWRAVLEKYDLQMTLKEHACMEALLEVCE